MAEIVGCELNRSSSDVFFQPVQLGCAGDGNHPGLLRQNPGECDLRGCRLLLFCNFANQIHYSLVGFAVLRREARHDVAEIGLIELRLFGDLARKKTFSQETEWNESDAKFLKRRQYFNFRLSPPQRVFALERSHRLDGVRAADRHRSRLREAEVLDLALLDQLLHRSRDVLHRHVRVDAVLVEQIDAVGAEPLQRGLGDFLDVFRPAVHLSQIPPRFRINFESELGGDFHLTANWSQRFAHQLFVSKRTVDFRGIKECNPTFNGRPNQRDPFLLVHGRAEAKAHAHAAQSKG